jgi:polysaccharide export outer membrane protein
VLKISVWQNPDLDQEVIVRPDGMISFPLIGDIDAKGLSITGLTRDITKRLSEFVKSPQVSVSLRKMGGSKVIILGEVMRPGVVSVTGAKTILEAIGQAGGFTRDAVPSSIVLIRGGLSQPQPQRLNLSKALEGRELATQNLALQSEDIIFVPKKFIADLSYFLGQILDPISKGVYTSSQLRSY